MCAPETYSRRGTRVVKPRSASLVTNFLPPPGIFLRSEACGQLRSQPRSRLTLRPLSRCASPTLPSFFFFACLMIRISVLLSHKRPDLVKLCTIDYAARRFRLCRRARDVQSRPVCVAVSPGSACDGKVGTGSRASAADTFSEGGRERGRSASL